MAPYEYVLRCTHVLGNSQRPASPDTEQALPIIEAEDKIFGICLVSRDSVGVFEEDGNTQRELPDGVAAVFRAMRYPKPSLLLTTMASKATVESPPTSELLSAFESIDVPSSLPESDPKSRIFLRPCDTVVFTDPPCRITVDVRLADRTSAPVGAGNADVQVKSSAAAEKATSETVAGEHAAADSETEDEDEDDVDGERNTDSPILKTPTTADVQPANFHTGEGTAVQDTPLRPGSNADNGVFSTAPDQQQSPKGPDKKAASTHATARNSQGGKARQHSSADNMEADNDSQHIFKPKPRYNTYGGTPHGSRPGTPTAKANEVNETPQLQASAQKKSASSAHVGLTPISASGTPLEGSDTPQDDRFGGAKAEDSAPDSGDEGSKKRKRLATENDDSRVAKEPTPVSKKLRGRPRKSGQAQSGATDSAQDSISTAVSVAKKPQGRPRKSDAADGDDELAAPGSASHPTSSGKLKRPGRQPVGRARQLADDGTDDDDATPASSFESKPPTKILLSKSAHAEDTKSLRWLKKNGVAVEEDVPGRRVNFICVVGIGELHTTPKLLRSLALGKKVVTDQWITDSMGADRILLIDPYIHDDLADTIDNDRRKLFVGKTVFFTTNLKASYGKAFASVEALATECGATKVDSGSATKGGDKTGAGDIIFLGKEDGDAIAQELMTDYKLPVYNKDLLIQSIIRGELLLGGDVYKLELSNAKTPAKRGRK